MVFPVCEYAHVDLYTSLTKTTGAVFTQSLTRSLRFGRAMEGGTICINCAAMFAPQVPNGGFKISGAGRELGEYAIRHYTEPRALFIK